MNFGQYYCKCCVFSVEQAFCCWVCITSDGEEEGTGIKRIQVLEGLTEGEKGEDLWVFQRFCIGKKDSFLKQEKRAFNCETLQWQREAVWFWGDKVRCRKLVDILQEIWPIANNTVEKTPAKLELYQRINKKSLSHHKTCMCFASLCPAALPLGRDASLFVSHSLEVVATAQPLYAFIRIIITGLKKPGSLHRSWEETVSSTCKTGVISFISRI